LAHLLVARTHTIFPLAGALCAGNWKDQIMSFRSFSKSHANAGAKPGAKSSDTAAAPAAKPKAETSPAETKPTAHQGAND